MNKSLLLIFMLLLFSPNMLSKEAINANIGKNIFDQRCILCHGESGQGNGRLAQMIKHPPPANLTLSQLSTSELKKIISLGGKAVGRSEKMPAWGLSLSDSEIDSVILYVKELKQQP